MNGSELSKIKGQIAKTCQNYLGGNLFAIIFAGSVPTDSFKSNWSDIDLLISTYEINLDTKQKVAKIVKKIESIYNRHVGTNLVSKIDITKPRYPIYKLEGKTLQTLLELKNFPERLIFINSDIKDLFVPSQEIIKEYSLANIGMFMKRNRHTLINADIELMNENDISQILKKEIRASFTITKLGLQYIGQSTSLGYENIIKQAELTFKNFSFVPLKRLLEQVNNWNQIKSKIQIIETLSRADSYIEKFSQYIFLRD